MKMSRVLLVDTNFSSAPIHDFLERNGYEVFVVGGNPNDFLAKTSRNYLKLDYSDPNVLRRVVVDHGIEFIVPGCNDRSYHVSSVVARECGLNGIDLPEVSDAINSKEKFRELAVRLGLSVPRVLEPSGIGNFKSVVVKPVDAYSGRGVTIVEAGRSDELDTAIEKARAYSRTGCFLIEEFVSGQLYSHSAFIADGQVVADFLVEEHCTANPFVVDTSRVVFDFPEATIISLRQDVRTLAAGLALVDGLVHTQFIKNGDDYWLIEVTRRCPGDLYSRLIELSTGFNYVENYVRPFIGGKILANVDPGKRQWIMRHTVTQAESGVMAAIGFNSAVQFEMLIPLLVAGDELRSSPQGRAFLMFARSESQAALDGLFARTIERNLYRIHRSITTNECTA